MKFLCVECDRQMVFVEREVPGDGTFAASFQCPACGRSVALLANPYETQLVSSLGVKIGGETVPAGEPLELVSRFLDAEGSGETKAAPPGGGSPSWEAAALDRLGRVPGFVRGMVKRIYIDYAREHGIAVITTAVMDRARSDLGLEGM